MIVIGALEVGQVVTIKEGFGHPAVAEDTQDTILAISGNSALTCGGVKLSQCGMDGYGIIPTDEIVESPEPGPEAQAILEELGLA